MNINNDYDHFKALAERLNDNLTEQKIEISKQEDRINSRQNLPEISQQPETCNRMRRDIIVGQVFQKLGDQQHPQI